MLFRIMATGLRSKLPSQNILLNQFKACPTRISPSKKFCTQTVDEQTYLYLSNETLESLNDRFDEIIEDNEILSGEIPCYYQPKKHCRSNFF